MLLRLCLLVLFSVRTIFGTKDSTQCTPGEVIENECNRCTCTSDTFNCLQKYCNMINPSAEDTCRPNILYSAGEVTCRCNANGEWPHKNCSDTFQTLVNSNISCAEDSYVMNDCNICKCGPNGTVNKNLCTKNNCSKPKYKISYRKSMTLKQIYQKCEINTWYSLKPCHFCYCTGQNKIICNTGDKDATMIIGGHQLYICGKDYIKEALELIPIEHLRAYQRDLQFDSRYTEDYMKNKVDDQMTRENEDNFNNESDESGMKVSIEESQKTEDKQLQAEEAPSEFWHKNKQSDVKPEALAKKNNPLTSLIEMSSAAMPGLMNKMFHLTMRSKEFLTVHSKTICKIGTTELVKCNICICVESQKFMCTDSVCE